MIFNPELTTIELTTATECRLVSDITRQLPDFDHPHGVYNVFLEASEADVELADTLSPQGHLLSETVYTAMSHGKYARDKNQIEPDSVTGLREFPTYTIGQIDSNTLVETTFLVATQQIRYLDKREPYDFEGAMMRAHVQDARLLGVLILGSNICGNWTPSRAELLSERYADPSSGYRESVSDAAHTLLSLTSGEFHDHTADYYNLYSFYMSAMRKYREQNPLIVALEKRTYDNLE